MDRTNFIKMKIMDYSMLIFSPNGTPKAGY